MKLILTRSGTAQLLDKRDQSIWSSDSDPEFKDEFPDDLLTEDDVEDVMNYLCDQEIISEDDIDDMEVFEDGINDGPGDDDDDDDDDDELEDEENAA